MLIYSSPNTPSIIKDFSNICQSDIDGQKIFCVCKDQEVFKTVLQKIKNTTIEWTQRDNYKIAYIHDLPLSPDWVAKEKQIINYTTKLNQFKWGIPLLRAFPEGTALPQNLRWNLDNQKILTIDDEYLNAAMLGTEILNLITDFSEFKKQPDFDLIAKYVWKLLKINYEVTLEDVKIHGLIDLHDWLEPLILAVDGKKMIEFNNLDDQGKKKFLMECGASQEYIDTFLASGKQD